MTQAHNPRKLYRRMVELQYERDTGKRMTSRQWVKFRKLDQRVRKQQGQ